MQISLATTILLTAAILAGAQEDTIPHKRLRAPAVAVGNIGGEAHDSYVVHADEGRTMSIEISWERNAGNQAQFVVSESPSFNGAEPVKFGGESDQGTRWSGKVSRTGDYHIYVVAHPAARYTLRVAVNGVSQ